MKGKWEKDCILPVLLIIFFLVEVQAVYDKTCENPRVPSATGTCGKGKFKDFNGDCQVCPDGQFQDAVDHVCGQCKNCTKCGDGEISEDQPFLCLTYKDTTCIKVNDSVGIITPEKSDGPATAGEGPFSKSHPTSATNLEESLKSTTEAAADDVTTPDSTSNQVEKHDPYKIGFYVMLVIFIPVVTVLVAIILWQRQKLKNGREHLEGNQDDIEAKPNGCVVNGDGQLVPNGNVHPETELTNMLPANGHVEGV